MVKAKDILGAGLAVIALAIACVTIVTLLSPPAHHQFVLKTAPPQTLRGPILGEYVKKDGKCFLNLSLLNKDTIYIDLNDEVCSALIQDTAELHKRYDPSKYLDVPITDGSGSINNITGDLGVEILKPKGDR